MLLNLVCLHAQALEEEEAETLVPSKSDVLDILNTASFGSNMVNSDNLKQVYKHLPLL